MARDSERWPEVTARNPCPICGGKTWCTIGPRHINCHRAPSAKERETGAGLSWLHPRDNATALPRVEREKKETPKLTTAELTALARKMFDDKRADARRESVARSLGVSVASLTALRVGYGADRAGEYSSWPARDWQGHIVGIVRRYDDGSKKSLKGGSTGLFYERDWLKRSGPVLIVEGGSDTAAAISLGLRAIGRPSNTGLGRDGGIKRMLSGARARTLRAIVIAEADSKPEKRGQAPGCPLDCQGCLTCFPGQAGAELVAKQLGCSWVLPPEGCKDFRDALNKGRLWPGLIQAL